LLDALALGIIEAAERGPIRISGKISGGARHFPALPILKQHPPDD
jgi:hypothetical protein